MDSSLFTHPITKGIPHKNYLPAGTGLVLEGGGTRGFFSAGVFEAFMEEGIMFPYIVSVSAGSANAFSYVSGQPRRGRLIVEKYVGDKKYVSYRNLFKYRSLFGYDFIFGTIPNKHVFWDRDNFNNTDIRFLIGAINCNTGKTVWFEKHELSNNFIESVASCSVPLVARIVRHRGLELLDGGVSDPIPIEKSIADGNKFHVVVLTRNQGFLQEAMRHSGIVKLVYRNYPNLVNAIVSRHEVYNKQLALCEQLVREGRAIIIRPQLPLTVGRSTRDTEKLLALYDEGHDEGRKAIKNILK